MRRITTAFGLVLCLTLGPVVLAQAPKTEAKPAAPSSEVDRRAAVKKALERSAGALRRGDRQAAIDAANEAVALDPSDSQAHLARAVLFQELKGAGTNAEMNRKMEQTVREDYRAASEGQPDSTAAGVARDALAQIEGHALFPDAKPACSKEALAELDTAEDLFNTNHLQESLAHFEKGAQICPEDPIVWTHYGDAYYALEDFAQARSRFEKAIAKSPWHAQGHRFLADTLIHQNQLAAAYHEAVLTVLSDPTYEAGWGGLRAYAIFRKGTWNRAYGAKPEVKAGPQGELAITLSPKASTEWNLYAITKVGFLLPSKDGAPPPPKTALDRERAAIQAVLYSRKGHAASGTQPLLASPFWDMMARADQAGFLDEAIFLHLLDRELLPEYLAFRDKNRDRLVRYVETVLAPLPPPSTAGP